MTDQDYDGASICGTLIQSIGPLAKWPGEKPRLPWHLDVTGYHGGLAADALRSAFARAFAYWSEFVEIDPVVAGSAAEALIRAHFAREDGPSGVLAWSYLADNTNSPKQQRYDNGEAWVVVNPERPTSGIDLVRVACHELGHMLGLEHDSSNADSLMRPSYSTSIPKPTARDIQRLVGLGYKRRTAPPPPPTPDPPPASGIAIGLPGGGVLTADYASRVITHPTNWTARSAQ